LLDLQLSTLATIPRHQGYGIAKVRCVKLTLNLFLLVASIHGAIAMDELVSDKRLKQRLLSKAGSIARELRWSVVRDPMVSEQIVTKGLKQFVVKWDNKTIRFTEDFWPTFCADYSDFRPARYDKRDTLSKLDNPDIKRVQARSRQVCRGLGLGNVAKFKRLEPNYSVVGMSRSVIRVECVMQTNAPLPIHELSQPIARMELDPNGLKVINVDIPLPITLVNLKKPLDERRAKQLISEYAKKMYAEVLDPNRMTVNLLLLDWPEGKEGTSESKRLYSMRRRLLPVYSFKGKMGEIWLDANEMSILGVRENPNPPPRFKRNPPPS